MNPSEIEEALRAGPPEEDRAPAVLFEPGPISSVIAPATSPVHAGAGSRSGPSGWPLLVAIGVLVVALAAFAGARTGQLPAPGAGGGPGASPVLAPAVIAPELRQAYADLVSGDTWMVCGVDAAVACKALPVTRPPVALIWEHPIVDPAPPTIVAGRHLVVGATFDPAHLPTAYLIPVGATPSATWQPLASIPLGGGDYLFDLPSVAPGHYLVALHSDELAAGGPFRVAGIQVRAP